MNKTIIGFVVAGLLITGLGVSFLFQQKQNIKLTRKISELENQIRALAEIGAASDASFESIQAEVARMKQAQAQLKTEHDAVAATVAAGNSRGKAPQTGMTPRTNQASILARLSDLSAEAYRLAASGVGPIQRNPLSGVPIHTLTMAQFLSLPPLLQSQYIAATERRGAMIAVERERISANAQFLVEQKLREMGADNQTIESARLAKKRMDEAIAQQRATSAQEDVASAIRRQAAAQEDTAQQLRMQLLVPPPTPLQIGPTKVKIVP